jgi:hypothetical protein
LFSPRWKLAPSLTSPPLLPEGQGESAHILVLIVKTHKLEIVYFCTFDTNFGSKIIKLVEWRPISRTQIGEDFCLYSFIHLVTGRVYGSILHGLLPGCTPFSFLNKHPLSNKKKTANKRKWLLKQYTTVIGGVTADGDQKHPTFYPNHWGIRANLSFSEAIFVI